LISGLISWRGVNQRRCR